MSAMNFFFCGLQFYVFVLTVLITLSAWQQRLRWIGLGITFIALFLVLGLLTNPGWLAALQFPLKAVILAGAILITALARRSDTRYIGLLLIVAAGGALAAHLISF